VVLNLTFGKMTSENYPYVNQRTEYITAIHVNQGSTAKTVAQTPNIRCVNAVQSNFVLLIVAFNIVIYKQKRIIIGCVKIKLHCITVNYVRETTHVSIVAISTLSFPDSFVTHVERNTILSVVLLTDIC